MAIDYPNDENGNVLRDMERDGVNLTLPRVMDFEHCFPGQAQAVAFKDQAREMVTEARIYEPDSEGDRSEWEVQCRVRLIPTHQAITDMENRLANIARANDGYPDGWGSLSNPDGTPAE